MSRVLRGARSSWVLMTGGRLGVSPRLGVLAAVWSVTRGGLKLTDGAGAEVPVEPVVSLRTADGSEVRRLLRDARASRILRSAPVYQPLSTCRAITMRWTWL